MTDWIDQESTRRTANSQARQHFWQIFTAMAERLWQHLATRLTQDADKLNQVLATEIKGSMRVNGRQQLPHRNQLFIDNLAYPAIYLDIELDSSARSIHIRQVRRECMEGKSRESHERMLLELDDHDEILVKDTDGEILSIDEVSKKVLSRFLRR